MPSKARVRLPMSLVSFDVGGIHLALSLSLYDERILSADALVMISGLQNAQCRDVSTVSLVPPWRMWPGAGIETTVGVLQRVLPAYHQIED